MGNSEWDDEELVGLNDLRPSRRVYGPAAQSQNREPSGKSQRQSRSSQQARQPARQTQPRQRAQQRQSRDGQNRQRTQQRSAQSRQQQRQPQRRDEFANDLAAQDRNNVSNAGWRGAIARATNGAITLGPSAHQQELAKLQRKMRRPVTNGTVAVFSRKGGVGKTTISAYLGLTLATERGGRVVALDGDAEAGSLGWLLAPRAPSTLAALASAQPIPSDYAEIRRYTTSTPEGLEVIVGDPAEMGPISTIGLEAVAGQLARHYDMSIFDTGAGVTRATGRVLVQAARTLLLVMSPSVDSVRAAERTLAWLEERPGEAANRNARVIAVINGIPSSAKRGHVERIESHFNERCSAVVRIPWDQHLATGSSSVSLDLLSKQTREAFIELAATTISTLARPNRNRAQRRELAGSGAH